MDERRGLPATRSIISASEEAIIQTADGRLTHVNAAAARMLGYDAEELVGCPEASLSPAGREQELDELRRHVRSGETLSLRAQRLRRDGTALDVDITVLPVYGDGGAVVGETAILREASEQLRQRDELAQTNASIRALFDLVPCGMSLRGLDGRYLRVNQAVADAFDTTPEALVGLDPATRHDREEAAQLRADDELMLRTGKPIVRQHTFRAADGATRTYHVVKYPVHDERGEMLGLGAFSVDLTERERVEIELRGAEERLLMLLEAAPDATLVVDADGMILRLNARTEELFGYSRRALLGERIETLIAPDLRAAHAAHRRDYVEGPQPQRYEVTGRRRDGSEFPIEVTLGGLFEGGESLVVTAIRDVTERKRTEAARADAWRRFRLAFEQSPIGVILLDTGGRFQQVNDAFCRIVGYERRHLLGMSFEAITHPDDITRNTKELLEVLDGQRPTYETEKRYIHASGHEVTVRLQTTLLRAEDGKPLNFLTFLQDVTDRTRDEQRLAHLADHDALTGLLNAGTFDRVLAAHALLGERYGLTGAVLVLDLDEFRNVNDRLGYEAADAVLARVAQLLASRLRASDVVARVGGNAFAVLLSRAGSSAAMHVAGSLLERLQEERIEVGEGLLTASVGIASFEDNAGLSAEEVLANATVAVQDAKGEGRQRVRVYRNTAHAAARAKGQTQWSRRIASAVRENRLILLAQPIRELASGRTAQYELLLRVRDERGDLIPPATFLYIAERLRLAGEIDMHVAARAIRMLATDPGLAGGEALEVNVSSASIGDPQFLDRVRRELDHATVDPSRLILDVPQGTALRAITKTTAFAEELARIGCRFALDGFGIGPGSFHYLKQLQFDLVKIDRELVRNCRDSDTDQLLIAAIVEVCRGLGRGTVAMEVSDEHTLMLLRELGVDYGQGYHLGPPAPLASSFASGEPRDPSSGSARSGL